MNKLPINSFNAGELSPYLNARSDLDKYNSGCLVMENFVPLPYGGASRRPALEYFGASKNDDKVRLIGFLASVENSFALEFGDQYIRFWKDGALIDDGSDPIEVGTPYLEAELDELKFTQSVDVMWITDGNNKVHRLSRLSSTEWTMEEETFDFPPLRAENDTDITLSPSATIGVITLTASRSFFNSGHVGGYFQTKALRCISQQAINDNMTADGVSDAIYAGGSDWEFETRSTWKGKVVIQRSMDGKATWEDYINVADTGGFGGSGAELNRAISSDEPEPFGSWLRVYFIEGGASNFSYELRITDVYFRSLVKVVGYTSDTVVTAEVIGDFQDTPSLTDYPAWASSASYSEGEKVSVPSGVDYVSGADETITSLDSNLDEVVGSDFGGDQFWFVTEGTSNQKIYKVSSDFSTLDATYDISSDWTEVLDVAFYADELYVSGKISSSVSAIKKYSTSGVLDSTVLTIDSSRFISGLGYYNGHFYLGIDKGSSSKIWKYTTSFVYTGTVFNTNADGKQNDITGRNGFIYVVNNVDDSVDIYNESLDSVGTASIASQTTSPSGLSWDGSNLWLVEKSSPTAKAYKYNLVSTNKYYECIRNHTSGVFSTDYNAGYWSDRTPEMTTWSEGAFSDYRGHPKSVALFENRLVYAGTDSDPDTIWMSKTEDYRNFDTGDLDSDGLKLVLGAGTIDEIQWLVPQEKLVIGTSGAEWVLGSSDERKAVTPLGYDLKRKSTFGSNQVQGLLVNSSTVFLMRQSRKVREWSDNSAFSDNSAPDLSILSEHITEGGISKWAYQQQPDNVLWMIRGDGTLVGFTYEKDQNVLAWHRHINSNFDFESITVLPKKDAEDEVWVSVKITVDGAVKRYIGKLDDREWGTNYLTQWHGLDLYKTYSSPGSATLTGLDYLEGEEVQVVAEGEPITYLTVSGAGTSAANGVYVYDPNDESYYDTTGTYKIWKWFNLLPLWALGTTDEATVLYYAPAEANFITPPENATWAVESGASDAPSFVRGSTFTVSIGQINVGTDAYSNVTVGLPFTSKLAPMYLNVSNQYGTSKGTKISTHEARVQFKDTYSAKMGQTDSSSDLEDVRWHGDSSPLYNEEATAIFSNASDFLLTTYIVQDDPMPCTVLSLIPTVETR